MDDAFYAVHSPWTVTTGVQSPETVERLLRSLPGWFGIESSIVEYVAAAAELPTYLARAERGTPAGWRAAGREALPRGRRDPPDGGRSRSTQAGVGRALVEALERDLAADGVRLLQVKTQGPSRSRSRLPQTRRFYEAMGFEPLEEITGLWPGNPCLFMVKVLGAGGAR